jgi:hypothetical protein
VIVTKRMFRSILLATLFASQAPAVAGTALSLSGKYPHTTVVPVKDFSVLLTFSETVQKSSNSVKVLVGDSTNNAADANKFEWTCSSSKAQWFNKIVLVPIAKSSGTLKAGTTMEAKVPSNCFKAYRATGASSTTDVYMNADATFRFTTEGADTCTNTNGGTPVLLTGLDVASLGSSVPYSPANKAWLSAPSSTVFDLYFSESLVAGDGLISITETTGSSSATVIDSFAPSASAAKITLDKDFKGRVQLN